MSFFAAHIGELSALLSALCWTTCAVAFTNAGRQVGSASVNLMRILMAGAVLLAVGMFGFGEVLPSAPWAAWGYLALSGLIGLFAGDLCLFEAYLLIGPRLGLLVFSLWPPLAAVLAWPLLGEALGVQQWLGMALTLLGVATVVLERPGTDAGVGLRRHYLLGAWLAIVASGCQAGGYVISKLGMTIMDPADAMPVRVSFQATQIRLFAALAGFVLLFSLTGRWGRFAAAARHKRAMGWLALGAVTGPALGVALGLFAMHYTQAGIAATIIATAPLLILPYAILVDRERVNPLTVLGAVVALVGLGVLAMAKGGS